MTEYPAFCFHMMPKRLPARNSGRALLWLGPEYKIGELRVYCRPGQATGKLIL
jgi:hypothetical protein